jgi:hypothetical protein
MSYFFVTGLRFLKKLDYGQNPKEKILSLNHAQSSEHFRDRWKLPKNASTLASTGTGKEHL